MGNNTGICPFLDELPVEIRIHIYGYLLFENGNFFSLDDEEGNSVPTLFPKLRAPPKRRGRPAEAEADADESQPSTGGESKRQGSIMSLLLTSTKIYHESASLLYSTSFFRLRGIHSTIQFINSVALSHLALVRSLKLVWDDQGWASAPEFDTVTLRSAWPSLCDALATNFSSLRHLYVALGMPSNEAHVEELYLGGLGRIGHVGNFKVCIPVKMLQRHYGLDREVVDRGRRYQDAPFALCRHTAGDICDTRREVIAAEWLGGRRPPTPGLKIQLPNVPGMEPWADGEWKADGKEAVGASYGDGGDGLEGGDTGGSLAGSS